MATLATFRNQLLQRVMALGLITTEFKPVSQLKLNHMCSVLLIARLSRQLPLLVLSLVQH